MRLVPPEHVRPRAKRAMRLVPVTWCIRGMQVFAPKPRRGFVLCEVVAAAGYRARVKNELHGIDAWMHFDSLRVRKDSHFAFE